MGKMLINVGTATHAMKGKEILFRHGISSYIQKIPGKKTGVGCSYGLVVNNNHEKAYEVLKNNGISVIDALGGENIYDIS